MAVEHRANQRYKIELTAQNLWSNIDFDLNRATEWCDANCSTWNADYHWNKYVQNYVWIFSFADESDKVKFILRWL